jgi:hypothetical protein
MPQGAFNLTWRVKSCFFDRAKVLATVGEATTYYLGASGALVRTIAQRSMRYRSPRSVAYAPAGSPPKAVRNHPWIRDYTMFAFDERTRSVVIGPVLLAGGRVNVPALHERGGSVWVRNPRRRVLKVGHVAPFRLAERGDRVTALVVPGRMGRVAARGTVRVALVRLGTGAQVRRAEDLAEKLYGPYTYRADYPPRPYMVPALEKAAPGLARIWAEAFGRAPRRVA